jgi:hypothetical protein
MGREWFTPSADILTWIDTLIAEYGAPDASIGRYTTPLDGPRAKPIIGQRKVRQRLY